MDLKSFEINAEILLLVGLAVSLIVVAQFFFSRYGRGFSGDGSSEEELIELRSERNRFIETKLERERLQQEKDNLVQQNSVLESKLAARNQNISHLEARVQEFTETANELRHAYDESDHERQGLKQSEAKLKAELASLKEKQEDTEKKFQDFHELIEKRFNETAREILAKATKDSEEENSKRLDKILQPFQQRITDFQKQVKESYDVEREDRVSLRSTVEGLMKQNSTLSEEARNLTKALTTDSQKQGAWGELQLETILTSCGLENGREYETQFSSTNDEGIRLRPDVIVHLPEEREIIIDAKASLTAYLEYTQAEDDAHRSSALGKHMRSINAHVKSLSGKNYPELLKGRTLDYVIMFMPFEGAFHLAVQEKPDLVIEAIKKRILICSPSTLVVVLRTVEQLWRAEKQNVNAKKISDQAAKLHDKLIGFVENFEKVGKSLNNSKKHYDDAFGQLATGRGNAIKIARDMTQLGVAGNKKFSRELVDVSEDHGMITDTSEEAGDLR